jgi:hypothetical protein
MKIFLTAFLFISFAASSQDTLNDILTTQKKREGVYRTFKEFRTNSPSIQGKVKVTNNRFKQFNAKKDRYENIAGEFWGACKNDTVYIFLKETKGPNSPHIYPMLVIGRYAYFKEQGPAAYGLGDVMHQGLVEAEYVVNINNGQLFRITNSVMKDILQKDPKLLEEFKSEEVKDDTYRKYILKVNESRRDDIKPPF